LPCIVLSIIGENRFFHIPRDSSSHALGGLPFGLSLFVEHPQGARSSPSPVEVETGFDGSTNSQPNLTDLTFSEKSSWELLSAMSA
jgi:hypothetical protein